MSDINVRISTPSGIAVKTKRNPSVLVNQSGLTTVRNLSELDDVDTSTKTDGSLLIYDETQQKFITSTVLDKQKINGGHF